MKTQAEDVTLRFRTSRPDGILLITSSSLDRKKRDTLHIALEARRVQVSLHISGISQVSIGSPSHPLPSANDIKLGSFINGSAFAGGGSW